MTTAVPQNGPNAADGKAEGGHAGQVRSYFDSNAEFWSRVYRDPQGANDVVLAERLRLALELTDDVPRGASVLDAGCGAGPLTVALAQRGHAVTAVDIAPRMVELCEEAVRSAGLDASSVRVRCGDTLAMDLESASFDVVYALGFLQYQEEEGPALERLRQLLRPGGRLVISGPMPWRIGDLFGAWTLVRRARRRIEAALGRPPSPELEQLLAISKYSYSLGRMKRVLGGAGFTVVALRPHGFVSYALIGPLIGAKNELRLHRFFSRLARWTPIDRFANDLVALAVKPGAPDRV